MSDKDANRALVSVELYEKAQQEIAILKHELSEMRRLIFGSKSERHVAAAVDSVQLDLFEDVSPIQLTVEQEEVTYTRNKPKKEKVNPVRTAIPDHLPRVEEFINPDIDIEQYKKIGEKITEILEYTPGKIFVRRIIRPQYQEVGSEKIIISPLPSLPIPKGNAGASLLAYILVAKFIDHLPFDRITKIFKRGGVVISKSTMNGWFMKATALLELLYQELLKQMLDNDYLQADETPIGVQDPTKKNSLHRGFQWVYRSPTKGLVLFKYDKTRSAKAPVSVLNDFNGALQTDGYIVYASMQTKGNIILLACMAHARRKFKEAEGMDANRANFALGKIQMLYLMERKAKERQVSVELIKRYRQLYAKPILNELEQWLKTEINQVVPKSAIGKAIAYSYKLWPRLIRYIDDGRYEIDNNMIENAIRPLALGRKNYLFAGSHEAAQKAAMMYSFFASCKVNDVNPLEWLTDILNRIQDTKISELSNLLPNNWKA